MKSLNFPLRSLALVLPLIFLLFSAMGLKAQSDVIVNGQLKGKVIYNEGVAALKKVDLSGFSDCEARANGFIYYEDEMGITSNSLANVFIRIVNPPKKNYPTPTRKKVIEMKACQFSPRVTGVMVNQPLSFKNSDGILFKLRGLSKANGQFNIGMPPTAKQKTMRFASPEGPYKVKCDVHPWMTGYVAVMTHPYFAVSDANGNYSMNLQGLPPGKYKIEAWHEKLGVRRGTVNIVVVDLERFNIEF